MPFVRGGKLKFYPALALEHDLEIIPLSFVRGGELKSEFEDFPSTDHPLALRVCDWVEGFKILIYFYLNKWCQNKKRASFRLALFYFILRRCWYEPGIGTMAARGVERRIVSVK